MSTFANPLQLTRAFATDDILSMRDVMAFAIVIYRPASVAEYLLFEILGSPSDPPTDIGLALYTPEGSFRVRDADIMIAIERLHTMMQYKKFEFVTMNETKEIFYWRRILSTD